MADRVVEVGQREHPTMLRVVGWVLTGIGTILSAGALIATHSIIGGAKGAAQETARVVVEEKFRDHLTAGHPSLSAVDTQIEVEQAAARRDRVYLRDAVDRIMDDRQIAHPPMPAMYSGTTP
jgi:hypothetical protein